MLPSLHRYPIGTEYDCPFLGKQKIIGYKSPYSCYSSDICYIVWNYRHNKEGIRLEGWIDRLVTSSA